MNFDVTKVYIMLLNYIQNMARPRRFRRISQEPQIRCFKPERDDIDNLDSIEILIDEFEAIRTKRLS
jgi:predicted DNA-binding protein (UPF0251 family)